MQNTTNYGFKKPDGKDIVNIQDLNYNFQSIDNALTPTADSVQTPTSDGPGKLVHWVSWFANRIKAITGRTTWWETPAKSLEDVNTHINATAPHSGHVSHSLATAVNDFLVASGAGVFVKKTLAEVKAILGLGSAAYMASTDYAPAAQGVINGNSHDHNSGDGAQISHASLSNIGTNTHMQIDAHMTDTTTAHGAASTVTANRIIIRDASGRAKVAAPSAADDIARKDTVDTVQTNLTKHANTSAPHNGHIAHSLATAANDFLVASGAGVFVKKTLAEVKAILGLGSAAYTNSTAYATSTQGIRADNAMPRSGGTFAGIITAQSNTSYTKRQVRNIIVSTEDAVLSSMQDGDIWFKYI